MVEVNGDVKWIFSLAQFLWFGGRAMGWFRSMQHSIVMKITALMGLLVVLIVAMVAISGVFSLNLRQNLNNMKNKN